MELVSGLWMLFTSIIVGLLGTLIAWFLSSQTRYAKVKKAMESQGIFGPLPASRILGNMLRGSTPTPTQMDPIVHNATLQIWPFHVHCVQVYGKNYIDWGFGLKPVLYVTDPQLSFDIQTRVMEKPRSFQKILDSVYGKGILNASYTAWSAQRASLNPAFHSVKIKMMVETMVDCVHAMMNEWNQKIDMASGGSAEIDVNDSMIELTSEIIGQTSFGTQGDINKKCVQLVLELQNQAIRQARYTSIVPGYKYMPTKENRRTWRMSRELYGIIASVIHERLGEAKRTLSFGNDLLGLLLSATATGCRSNKLDMSYLVDQCKNFFLAGHETSSHLLSWTMLLLALHPEWQGRARQEVRSLEGKHTADLNKLKLVGMIVSEAQRLYSIAPQIGRETFQDMYLNASNNQKVFVPRGVLLLINTITIHHDRDLWGEDADEFKPERFGNQAQEEAVPGKYSPFGVGPRMCLGRSFALTEMKLVMAMLLNKFEWRLSPSYRHSPALSFTVHPRYGMPLIISSACM